MRSVASSVIAPTLLGYVLWLLNKARATGLDRLYFVSRDGQILLKVAREINDRLRLGFDLRYLYGSRQAWHLPSITTIGPAEIAWLFDKTDYLSVASLFVRLQMAPSGLATQLKACGFPESSWKDNLTPAKRLALHDFICTSTVSEVICRHAADRRRLCLGYLTQEGLLDKRAGIVDLGWHGRMADSLRRILSSGPSSNPDFFYFALLSGAADPHKHAYFMDKSRNLGWPLAGDAVPMMEVFCAADHGTVCGYEEERGCYVPILREPINRSAIGWGLPIVHQTIVSFARVAPIETDWINGSYYFRGGVDAVLAAFVNSPSQDEARAWGAYEYFDDQGEVFSDHLAAPYGLRNVVRTALLKPYDHRRTRWFAGSRRLTPLPIRLGMRVSLALASRIRKRLDRKAIEAEA